MSHPGNDQTSVDKAASEELNMLMEKAAQTMIQKLEETRGIVQKIMAGGALSGNWQISFNEVDQQIQKTEQDLQVQYQAASSAHGQMTQNYKDVDTLAASLFQS